uniref:Shroom family member 1 n=1 Tax=Jaculus jaculus TaxID=51337 RepID=A0A8C5L4M9_JACJA
MDALGPADDRVSPASCTGSLDLRRLSTRVDSAYSSLSAASGEPEPRTPSPGTELRPYLDSAYVSVVWGGPSSAAQRITQQRPGPAAPARTGPCTPQIPGTPGPLSRQATPLLYAHPGAQEPARSVARTLAPAGRRQLLANQQRTWCFSEPGKLDRVGWGGGHAGERSSEAGSGSGLARPDPPRAERAEFQDRRPRSAAEVESGPMKLGCVPRPANRSQSTSGEVLGRCRRSERTVAAVQAVSQGSEPPRPLFQAKVQHASDQQCKNGLSQRAGQTTVPVECPFHESQGTPGADDHWQGVNSNGSVGIFRPISCSPSGTADGDFSAIDSAGPLTPDPSSVLENKPLKCSPADALGPSGRDTARLSQLASLAWGTGQPGSKPTWPSQRFEELVQELARLDPSLSDTLASQPSPEPPLGLLDGLIPSSEVWAAMRPAEEEAIGGSEEGSYRFSLTQPLPTSQKKTRSENSTLHPVPDQTCGQGLPTPNSMQAKKVELASLLQKMLLDLREEQERLQGADAAWTRHKAALEAAVGQACAPRELERFSRFMTDLERVLGLLLLLGSRLARVRLALTRAGSDGDPDERESLLQRLELLRRQQEDAQELKEHVARRERALREVLGRALPAEDLHAYCALLAGKAAVLAHQRSLDERVRLLEDQLDAIRHDLGCHPLSPRLF